MSQIFCYVCHVGKSMIKVFNTWQSILNLNKIYIKTDVCVCVCTRMGADASVCFNISYHFYKLVWHNMFY